MLLNDIGKSPNATFKKINHISNADSDGKTVAKAKNSDGASLSARETYMQKVQNRSK